MNRVSFAWKRGMSIHYSMKMYTLVMIVAVKVCYMAITMSEGRSCINIGGTTKSE